MVAMVFALGILGGLLLVVIVKLICGRKVEYDERQLQVQGRAYKAAFYTLLMYMAARAIYSLTDAPALCDEFMLCIIGICLAVTVFAVVCVFGEAYFSLRNSRKRYIAILFIGAASNLALGMGAVARGEIVTGGVLTYKASNFIVGVMSALVLAAVLIKFLLDKREDA